MMSRIVSAALTCAALSTAACPQEAPAPVPPAASASATSGFSAPDSAWRTVPQDRLMYIETTHGLVVVELFDEIAPRHAGQIKALTKDGFYDLITFHRVIDGFMNQTGDPTGTGTGDSKLPNIEAEFTFNRPSDMKITLLDKRLIDQNNSNGGTIDVGFYKGLPVATESPMKAALTGKVKAWGLHCPGVTSMARAGDPNSGNSQFFLMRGPANFLDQQYSIWGNTVYGRDLLTKFKVGTKGETVDFVPDQMEKVRMGDDLPASKQLNIQVLKTEGADFKRHLASFKSPTGQYPDICDVDIPVRTR